MADIFFDGEPEDDDTGGGAVVLGENAVRSGLGAGDVLANAFVDPPNVDDGCEDFDFKDSFLNSLSRSDLNVV